MKKCIILIAIITLLPLSISTAQLPGDLDCSGNVTGLDITYLASYFYCQFTTMDDTVCTWVNGDMNLDGIPHTVADWWMFFKYFAIRPSHNPPISLILDTIRVENVYCSPGDTVAVPVHIYSPDDISGAMLQIPYDNTYIEDINYDYCLFEDGRQCIDDNKLWILRFNSGDMGINSGNHIMGNIKIIISESAPPGTVIPLEPIFGDRLPSGISNWSWPSYFKWPTLIGGAVHVVLTDVDENDLQYESSLKLANYPNPFNSSTAIEFALENESNVELGIYDITGRLITTPIKGRMMVGYHEIIWNAEENTSGIYLYKLTTSDGSITKRMTLLK
jgi:hypothetical protein